MVVYDIVGCIWCEDDRFLLAVSLIVCYSLYLLQFGITFIRFSVLTMTTVECFIWILFGNKNNVMKITTKKPKEQWINRTSPSIYYCMVMVNLCHNVFQWHSFCFIFPSNSVQGMHFSQIVIKDKLLVILKIHFLANAVHYKYIPKWHHICMT